MIEYPAALIIGYLLGSIPFGLLITRMAGLGDVRNIGSGNIGTTNVLRTGRRELAALTLIGDAGKGAVAVLAVRYFFGSEAAVIAGVAAFLGHCFPVWLGFKGGKGVATYIGVMLALNWIVGLLFCVVWIIIAVIRRYSSLAALIAAASAPVFAWIWDTPLLSFTAACMTLVLFYKHVPNIMRLMEGTETKIGDKGKQSESGA
ncbi:glycerol-3-phosphate 1-O-acyltransferase PlsY [Cucumibacter marinus]|uniref:glycerol-3-phosphate 1-O-acyltransferase PlsY n=1 Tax=Cucumibacter marinus TaxID=1121252 RepID=UPI00048A5205|nr:glycerol-3-phosphate 1-O-acyltransferase PlsY [Cucumibacter marinus]